VDVVDGGASHPPVEAGVVDDELLPDEPFVDSFFVAPSFDEPSFDDSVLAPFFEGSLFGASDELDAGRLSLR
jgi:hypothetical protein